MIELNELIKNPKEAKSQINKLVGVDLAGMKKFDKMREIAIRIRPMLEQLLELRQFVKKINEVLRIRNTERRRM